MRPYHNIPIVDNREPLVLIPQNEIAIAVPHPYQKLGAPYQEANPFMLREGVVARLLIANHYLSQLYPWRIQVFDAYRPIAVQEFMVNYTYHQLRQTTSVSDEEVWEEVKKFWADPSLNSQTPPPHSTGGAVDITIIDQHGFPLDMGSIIDEVSQRSYPDFYQDHPNQSYHNHRQILNQVMTQSGFARHLNEWWHFSYGDQMWAWLSNQPQAIYGRID